MSLFPSRHHAVVAGLMLSLTLGGVATAAPKVATATQSEGLAGSSVAGSASAGTSSVGSTASGDKSQIHKDDDGGLLASLFSLFSGRSAARLEPVSLSAEMKYFTRFESAQNYDQGFSAGDGYNAMGYYQFDRRWSLVPFMQQAYAYNPTKYAMFKPVLDRASELKSGTIYDASSKRLTTIGQLASDAWHAAYKADPQEFAALQDSYAYNEYYLAVERTLKSGYGVDISDRADAVKGLAWGMCNLFGSSGVKSFFAWAVADSGMSDAMTDRELVEALCDAVVDHIKEYAPSQSRYWAGWINRYEKERAIVLQYVAEDEQEAAESQKPEAEEPGAAAPDTGEQQPDGTVSDGDAQQPGASTPDTEVAEPETGKSDTEVAEPETGKSDAAAPETGEQKPETPKTDASGAGASGTGTTKPSTSDQPTSGMTKPSATQKPEAQQPEAGGSASSGQSGTSGGQAGTAGGQSGTAGSGNAGSSGQSSAGGSGSEKTEGDGSQAEKSESGASGDSSSGDAQKEGGSGSGEVDETDSTDDGSGNGKKSEIELLSEQGDGSKVAGGSNGSTEDDASQDKDAKGNGSGSSAGASVSATAQSALPQTGDAVPLVLQAAAGLALTGTSVVALGSKRRKQDGE